MSVVPREFMAAELNVGGVVSGACVELLVTAMPLFEAVAPAALP